MWNASFTTGQSGSVTEVLNDSKGIKRDCLLRLQIGAVRHGASVRVRRRAATVQDTLRR